MEQNESKIKETIVTGRKFRRLDNSIIETWERFCGWAVTDRPFRKGTPITINKA